MYSAIYVLMFFYASYSYNALVISFCSYH